MSHELRTLHSYWSVEEAHLARVQLEAAGVRAFVADATTLGMAWHLGNALEGAKLQVADDDVERATEVLEQDESWQPDDGAFPETDDDGAIDADHSEPEDWNYGGTLDGVDSIRKPIVWLLLWPVMVVALAFVILLATSIMEIISG
jgi:hypothetical protein